MKPNYASLFSNRLVKSGEYLCRVDHVSEVDLAGPEKGIYVEVTLESYDMELDGTRLVAILHPTEKGRRYVEAFLESFRVTRATLSQAVGRWAAVFIYDSLYKGSAFSCVKFHAQTQYMQKLTSEREAGSQSVPSSVPRRECDDLADEKLESQIAALSKKLDSLGS